eukprot:jgi/Tetstr1/436987/TSEL_025759.t1
MATACASERIVLGAAAAPRRPTRASRRAARSLVASPSTGAAAARPQPAYRCLLARSGRLNVAAASSSNGAAPTVDSAEEARPLKVLVAGGGIGGLAAGIACRQQGLDVQVFEKVQQYKPFGGPIQLQCNALGALECIAPNVLEKVLAAGTVTGDRINGLLDGETGEWFYRFDTRKPCFKHGLPLTTVVSRYDLLDFLRSEAGDDVVTGSEVVSYENTKNGVSVTLQDGTVHHGDVLIGADGIRSKVRAQMRNEKNGPPLKYAGYAVYT